MDDASTVREVRFPSRSGGIAIQGIEHAPPVGSARAGLVIAHGRSSDLRNRLVRRMSVASAESGIWALRFNFRYVETKGRASRDLSAEEDDLRGALAFARAALPSVPIFAAGVSMGARVCARASFDVAAKGIVALGYPLHPRFRPEVLNPPEWPYLVKPALFVQGDHDPFCDLDRLKGELTRLREPHELAVIRNAGHSFEPIGERRDTFPELSEVVLRWIEDRTGFDSSG